MRIGKQLLDLDFYSRPCGRGDLRRLIHVRFVADISTHAPAGGATFFMISQLVQRFHFYSRPCGRGDHRRNYRLLNSEVHFYSRPCGRGDSAAGIPAAFRRIISTHAPAGGATRSRSALAITAAFLLTPLREGRHKLHGRM